MIGVESKQAVVRAREKLVETGFIEFQKGKKGSPNRYYLGKRSHNVTENVTKSVTVSVPVSVTENVTHNKTERKTKTNTPLPPQGETGFGNDLQEAFESWLSYKAEKRQAYKPTGLKSLITEIRNNAQKYPYSIRKGREIQWLSFPAALSCACSPLARAKQVAPTATEGGRHERLSRRLFCLPILLAGLQRLSQLRGRADQNAERGTGRLHGAVLRQLHSMAQLHHCPRPAAELRKERTT